MELITCTGSKAGQFGFGHINWSVSTLINALLYLNTFSALGTGTYINFHEILIRIWSKGFSD